MAGFDIFAAEQVIALKKRFPQIQLISVLPYKMNLFSREKCWTPDWISRAREIFSHHDMGVNVAERYRPGIYRERNRVLVDHSSELLCHWDGGGGGTKYAVGYAEREKVMITNIAKAIQNG